MCTAITYKTRDFYFGRTLDYERSFGEEVTITPRNFSLRFREAPSQDTHYAIIGMAHVERGYPLYYDAVNEQGLAMAGLNFTGNAVYRDEAEGKENVAHFELIPWLLGRCASVSQAKKQLERLNLTDVPFGDFIPSQLHWILADREETLTIEAVEEGLRIYDNPVGVLTNHPPFEMQMFHLNQFMALSTDDPKNRFCPELPLQVYSRGMGGIGLPGDLSSQSRFVRAAFVKGNAVSGEGEEASVNQFFHILGAVEQQRGCCKVGEGYEITLYTSCCNADKGIYYYTTYENHAITAVDMHREELNGSQLIRYPLIQQEQIRVQNARKTERQIVV